MILHRIESHICADYLKSLDFKNERAEKCIQIFGPRKGMWDGTKIGIGAPPIKTKKGWLLLYHGISNHGTYRVGAVLLDLKDPSVVLARTADPILEPKEAYEKTGQVGNVVFPCGVAVRKGDLFIYYGGSDSVVCVAKVKLAKILGGLA